MTVRGPVFSLIQHHILTDTSPSPTLVFEPSEADSVLEGFILYHMIYEPIESVGLNGAFDLKTLQSFAK
jgi:hypothetical protein